MHSANEQEAQQTSSSLNLNNQLLGRHRLPQIIPLRKPSLVRPGKTSDNQSKLEEHKNSAVEAKNCEDSSEMPALIDLRKIGDEVAVLDLSTITTTTSESPQENPNLQIQINSFVQHLHNPVRLVPPQKRISSSNNNYQNFSKLAKNNVPDKKPCTFEKFEKSSKGMYSLESPSLLESDISSKAKDINKSLIKIKHSNQADNRIISEKLIEIDDKFENKTDTDKLKIKAKYPGSNLEISEKPIDKIKIKQRPVETISEKAKTLAFLKPFDSDKIQTKVNEREYKIINKSVSNKEMHSDGKEFSKNYEFNEIDKDNKNCQETNESLLANRRKRKSSIYFRDLNDKELKVKKSTQKFIWENYLTDENAIAAPLHLFRVSKVNLSSKNSFQVGSQLEGIDPRNQMHYCVLSVAEVLGLRLRLHFDGFSESYDFWTDCDSPFIFPCGWCSENGKQLTPHPDYEVDEFEWNSYLKSRNTIAAKRSLFPWLQQQTKTNYNRFRIGDKLEAVDRQQWASELVVCVATVGDILWSGTFIRVHFDSWDSIYDYWCHVNDPCLRPVGWCRQNHLPISPPDDVSNESTFTWEDYLISTKSNAARKEAFNPRECSGFEAGMKVEVVDKRNPILIRVASIIAVEKSQLNQTLNVTDEAISITSNDPSKFITQTTISLIDEVILSKNLTHSSKADYNRSQQSEDSSNQTSDDYELTMNPIVSLNYNLKLEPITINDPLIFIDTTSMNEAETNVSDPSDLDGQHDNTKKKIILEQNISRIDEAKKKKVPTATLR